MRTRISVLAVVVALGLSGVAVLAASTVRGRIVRKGPSGQYAVPGVPISVYATGSNLGRSAQVYTGSDGMYYLSNVRPGTYQLEVWVSKQQRLTYNIHVKDQPFTDIAPVVIP